MKKEKPKYRVVTKTSRFGRVTYHPQYRCKLGFWISIYGLFSNEPEDEHLFFEDAVIALRDFIENREVKDEITYIDTQTLKHITHV